jgi:trimethylamine corrinoid protein
MDTSKERLFAQAKEAIVQGDRQKAEEIARMALAEKIDPVEILQAGFIPGINNVGDCFGTGKLFLPDLILAAEAMRAATAICSEALPEEKIAKKAKIVIGTVEGDIHDIGKAIVVSLLKANGFEIFDLGRDVPTQKFIEKAQEVNADVIGSSCLLTTTMDGQKKLEQELRKAGLRDKFKTIIGGAPVTQRWADRIGADAYAEDAADAVKKIKALLGL